MIRLTIIIPLYNAGKYIERSLRSCFNQNLEERSYEIIVINDGSTDNGPQIVDNLFKNRINCKIIQQENQGLSVARNIGLDLSHGHYIVFLDADDWLEENCLGELLDICETKELDMLDFCAADVINDKIKRRFSKSETIVRMGKMSLDIKDFQPCAPFSMYKRSFLIANSLKFFPGIFHEDADFKPRAYYLAKRVFAINKVCYYVNQTPNSITRGINHKKAFDLVFVAKRLSDFSTSLNPEEQLFFRQFICILLNAALENSQYMDASTLANFDKHISNNLFLFKNFKASGIIKYKIEGIILYSFKPFMMFTKTYNLLKKYLR